MSLRVLGSTANVIGQRALASTRCEICLILQTINITRLLASDTEPVREKMSDKGSQGWQTGRYNTQRRLDRAPNEPTAKVPGDVFVLGHDLNCVTAKSTGDRSTE